MLIPERICTLSLVSTAAVLFRTTVSFGPQFIYAKLLVTQSLHAGIPDISQGFVENLYARANLFVPKAIDVQIDNVKRNLYTQAWLEAPDTLEHAVKPFPTNGDRFAANELWKRTHPEYFQKGGFILQAAAAWLHYKSPEDLHKMANTIGKSRIMVVHGTQDRMLTFPLGVVLWRGLEKGQGRTGKENWLGVEEEKDVWEEGEVEKHFIKGQGHVLPIEMREEFNRWFEGLIKRGEALNEKEGIKR